MQEKFYANPFPSAGSAAPDPAEAESGAKPVLGSSYKGTLMQLPNGGTVGFRTMMSRSPGTAATIDVNIPGFFQGKLKFNP